MIQGAKGYDIDDRVLQIIEQSSRQMTVMSVTPEKPEWCKTLMLGQKPYHKSGFTIVKCHLVPWIERRFRFGFSSALYVAYQEHWRRRRTMITSTNDIPLHLDRMGASHLSTEASLSTVGGGSPQKTRKESLYHLNGMNCIIANEIVQPLLPVPISIVFGRFRMQLSWMRNDPVEPASNWLRLWVRKELLYIIVTCFESM